MKVAAVVLNWRRADDTIACVRSLREAAPEVGAIVVDNGSGGDDVARIRAALPDARLVENERNRGYAGGNDAGIAVALDAGADAVLVLNNDVLVQPGCVSELRAGLDDATPIVAPVSLRASDPATVDFLRGEVDLRAMAVRAPGRDEPLPGALEREIETGYATGSALLLSAGFLRRCGAFDEDFFLVWEDVDLCLRARAAGARVVVRTDARVLHAGSVSFGGAGSALYRYFLVRNSFLIARKHLRAWRRARGTRLLQRRYAGWVEHADPDVARAIALGVEHGLEGRFGPPPAELLPA